ncbi:MAG TPA: ATP-binding cassette domain-containing protein, partial [Nocardioidaceae bacterium]
FQFFNLLPALSAGENVELPLLLTGQRRGQARRTAAELLRDLGVADKQSAAPGRLSGGQQQRVALARALANDPDLILADEPTGNLDSSSTRDVLTLLKAAHQRGRAVLVATHDPRVAAAADRVLTMRDGQITDDRAFADARPVSLPFEQDLRP